MSQLPRRFTSRWGPVALAASMALAGGLTLAANSAGGATAAGSPVPVIPVSAARVGHFLCYKVTSPLTTPTGFSSAIATVNLMDRFHPAGPYSVKLGPVGRHCNPANKYVFNGQPIIYQTPNPQAHLACFSITTSNPFPGTTVGVANQFGTTKLQIGAQNALCLPTWKSLIAFPNKAVAAPPGLDHYTCYTANYIPGTPQYVFGPYVGATDEFNPLKPIVINLTLPGVLCVPTIKFVGTTQYKASMTDPSLLCFTSTQTPIKPVIYDQNQFGKAKLNVLVTRQFCVPSKVN